MPGAQIELAAAELLPRASSGSTVDGGDEAIGEKAAAGLFVRPT